MDKILISIMAFYYFYIVFLLLFTFTKRKKAIKNGSLKASYFKAYNKDIDDSLRVYENHLNNQFQVPVVFLIICLLALQQNMVNGLTIALAIGFVVTRICHSCIHLGSNAIIKRAMVYFCGLLFIGAMMIQILIACFY